MTRQTCFLLTDDESLFARFRQLSDAWAIHRLGSAEAMQSLPGRSIVVVDTAHQEAPAPSAPQWKAWSQHLIVVVVSSQPNDEEGIQLLDQGVAGYGHAYAAVATLRQILEVVASGELWVGRSLMQRLLRGVAPAGRSSRVDWQTALTDREREVAQLTANANSNADIAQQLGITERTVKAHLTAIFEKLEVADRLQLALKIHGIR